MDVVIDAQIVCGFFRESVLSQNTELTGSTLPIFDRLGNGDIVYLDENSKIENEWRGIVDNEWFDAWYPELLISGKAQLIKVRKNQGVSKQLLKNNFPTHSKDAWYVLTAINVKEMTHRASLLSEDLDFYAPKEKGCKKDRRLRILLTCSGKMAKYIKNVVLIYTALPPM